MWMPLSCIEDCFLLKQRHFVILFFSFFLKFLLFYFYFFNTKLFQAPEKVQVDARKLEHLQKKVDTATESSFLPEQTVMHGRWVGQTISLSRSIEIYKETGTYVWWCLNLQTRMWSWVLGSNWRNKTVTESCCTSRHQHTAKLPPVMSSPSRIHLCSLLRHRRRLFCFGVLTQIMSALCCRISLCIICDFELHYWFIIKTKVKTNISTLERQQYS